MPKFKVDLIRTYRSGDTASVDVEAATNEEAEAKALDLAKQDGALRWNFGSADDAGYDRYEAAAQVQP